MPMKQWAVGEEVLAADFNSYVQNQTVAQFANVAGRDTQWSSPPNGAFCVTTDTGTLWHRSGATWYPCFRRIMGTSRATNGPAGAAEGIVLLSPSFSFPSGRLIRVMAGWRTCSGTAGDGMIVRIREGSNLPGTELATATVVLGTSGALSGVGSGGTISAPAYVPAVGVRQWMLTSASTSANPVTMIGPTASANPIWLDVIDEGTG